MFSSLDANVVEGPLTIRAGVSAANVDRAVASIDEEVTRLLRDGVTVKELNESRQYWSDRCRGPSRPAAELRPFFKPWSFST